MKTPLDVIQSLKIPTDSYLAAIQALSDRREYFTKDKCEKAIASIVGAESFKCVNDKQGFLYLRYVVQETIKQFQSATVPDMNQVLERAIAQANQFVDSNPWTIKEYQQSYYNPTTEPSQKRGVKKHAAEDIFHQMNDQEYTRRDVIARMVEEGDMSKAAASTYFQMFKKLHGFRGSKKSQGPKVNKKRIAEEIYTNLSATSTKGEIIQAIIERVGTTMAGANTYYCAAKKKLGDLSHEKTETK